VARKQTQEQFIQASVLIHGYKYDYSKVEYAGNNIHVIIICPTHGEFKQLPRLHSNEGKGCFQCGVISRYYTTEEFILSAQKVHNNIFDYSKVKYTHSWNDITIICKIHGEFEQKASHHLSGCGCPKCGKILSQEEFVEKANLVHNKLYDYSKSIYVTAHVKLIIICSAHGNFEQRPDHHLSGHGCDKCRSSISKIETIWLNLLNIPESYRQTIIKIDGKKLRVDALDPITNTVYEFYGDYWHGNPKKFVPDALNTKANKTYGELFSNTVKREELLKQLGYNIVSIWQSDFIDSL